LHDIADTMQQKIRLIAFSDSPLYLASVFQVVDVVVERQQRTQGQSRGLHDLDP
jgi:hypothetical protein